RHEAVPIRPRAVRYGIEWNNPRWQSVVVAIEENQLDAGAAARIDAEIRSLARDLDAKRRTRALAIGIFHGGTSCVLRMTSIVCADGEGCRVGKINFQTQSEKEPQALSAFQLKQHGNGRDRQLA